MGMRRTQVDTIETLQTFEAQIFANTEQVIIAAVIPSQNRMIQLPFGRLEFVAFLREMEKAMERVPSAEDVALELDDNGNGKA